MPHDILIKLNYTIYIINNVTYILYKGVLILKLKNVYIYNDDKTITKSYLIIVLSKKINTIFNITL